MTKPVLESAPRYTSRPVTIEALQWTGDNIQQLWDWITAEFLYGPVAMNPTGPDSRSDAQPARLYASGAWLNIEVGEWIIRDDHGFYPCKDSVFRRKYRPEQGSSAKLKTEPHILIQEGKVLG